MNKITKEQAKRIKNADILILSQKIIEDCEEIKVVDHSNISRLQTKKYNGKSVYSIPLEDIIRVDTINAIKEIVEEVYEGQPNTLSDRIYYGAKWDKIKKLLTNTPSTPTKEDTIHQLLKNIEGQLHIAIYDIEDNKIWDCSSKGINNLGIKFYTMKVRKWKIENGGIVRIYTYESELSK